jgi:hypothetical protein
MTLAAGSGAGGPSFATAPVRGSVGSAAGGLDGPVRFAGTASGSSTATKPEPDAGTRHCNTASRDAAAETEPRIPSANIAASADDGRVDTLFRGSLDFCQQLFDLRGWGSWEVLAPGQLKSRRGIRLLSEAPFDAVLTSSSLNSIRPPSRLAPPDRHPLMSGWPPLARHNGLLLTCH